MITRRGFLAAAAATVVGRRVRPPRRPSIDGPWVPEAMRVAEVPAAITSGGTWQPIRLKIRVLETHTLVTRELLEDRALGPEVETCLATLHGAAIRWRSENLQIRHALPMMDRIAGLDSASARRSQGLASRIQV